MLYTFQLPSSVDGMTHVAVLEEIRDKDRIKVTGVYGKERVSGFVRSTHMVPFQVHITGERLADLDDQSYQSGRPDGKEWHDMDHADVAGWLAEDPDIIQRRIEANCPETDEEEEA